MDVRKCLCTFKPRYRTRNYEPNDCNLIYGHNQDYYRKSYFIIRTNEPRNSLSSEIKSVTLTLICFKTAFLICMFPRDQLITLRVRMQDISFVCKSQQSVLFCLHFFHIFQFYFKILLTCLNIGVRSQFGRKFCSFPLSRPIYFDYALFLCNYVTN